VCVCVCVSGINGSRSTNLLELLNHLQDAIAVLSLIQHAAETGASAGVDRQLTLCSIVHTAVSAVSDQ
jgi:hypothetical protein